MLKQSHIRLLFYLVVILLLVTTTPSAGRSHRRRNSRRDKHSSAATDADRDCSTARERPRPDRPKKRQTDAGNRVAISLNPLPPSITSPSGCVCNWVYYEHEDSDRIPRRMPFARCTNHNDDCRGVNGSCHEVNYTATVLRRSTPASQCGGDSLDNYEVAYEQVPVACVCLPQRE